MKKLLSLALSAALMIGVFAGCSPEDAALFKALMKEPDSCVETAKTSFDVVVEEPITYNGEDADYYESSTELANYLVQMIGGLLSISDVEQVVKKSGNTYEQKQTITTPDASFSFTSWVETDEQGMPVRNVLSLPSYVKPFLPPAVNKKQYLIYSGDPNVMMELIGLSSAMPYGYYPEAENDFDMAVIGGADGPTAVFTEEQPDPEAAMAAARALLKSDAVVDSIARHLNVSVVSDVQRSGDTAVYTVSLDGKALKGLVRGVIEAIGNAEFASQLNIPVISEEDLKDAGEAADVICDFIEEAGLFDKGLTVKYTLRGGYIVHEETDMEMTFDIPRIIDAAIKMGMATSQEEITQERLDEIAAERAAMDVRGRFRISARQVCDYTDINAPVSVAMPALTDENSIDYAKDVEEYNAYIAARMEWDDGWYDYDVREAYVEMLQPGDTLVLRNNSTGAEVTTTPITRAEMDPLYDEEEDGWYYSDEFYIPAADLAQIFDNMTVTWNGELSGVVVSGVGTYSRLYLDDNGVEKYNRAVFGDMTAEEYYEQLYTSAEESSDYSLLNRDPKVGTPYEEYTVISMGGNGFYNDRFYVSYDSFNYVLDVRSRFEDGKYCYTPCKDTEYDDSGMSGNLLYEFGKLFGNY